MYGFGLPEGVCIAFEFRVALSVDGHGDGGSHVLLLHVEFVVHRDSRGSSCVRWEVDEEVLRRASQVCSLMEPVQVQVQVVEKRKREHGWIASGACF